MYNSESALDFRTENDLLFLYHIVLCNRYGESLTAHVYLETILTGGSVVMAAAIRFQRIAAPTI